MAVVLGTILYWAMAKLGPPLHVTLVPPPAEAPIAAWRLPVLVPEFAQNWQWWQRVFAHALAQLPVMLPFALATIVGGIDCTESAAAAGDEFDTRSILWTEAIASLVAGLAGGVIQNTPYIGQPAYKTMGGRAAYTLATAVFIGLAGGLGWFAQLFHWMPEAVCFPILVFVGLEIGAQSFRATPTRHYAAVVLAMLPALAYLAMIPLGMARRAESTGAAGSGGEVAGLALPGRRFHRDEPALGRGAGGDFGPADVSGRVIPGRGRRRAVWWA